MARFNFRLKTLMKIREATRDERALNLAEAVKAEQTLDAQASQFHGQVHDLQQEYRNLTQERMVDVDRLLDVQRYQQILRAQREDLLQKKAMVTTEVQRRRQLLLEADQEVRVLEKFREKKWQRFQVEEKKIVQKELDEVAGRLKRFQRDGDNTKDVGSR